MICFICQLYDTSRGRSRSQSHDLEPGADQKWTDFATLLGSKVTFHQPHWLSVDYPPTSLEAVLRSRIRSWSEPDLFGRSRSRKFKPASAPAPTLGL